MPPTPPAHLSSSSMVSSSCSANQPIVSTSVNIEPESTGSEGDSSSSASSSDECNVELSRAEASRAQAAKQQAAQSVRRASTALRHAQAEHTRAKKLERELTAAMAIGNQTPHSAARQLERQRKELDQLISHDESKAPRRTQAGRLLVGKCRCTVCRTRRARELLKDAQEEHAQATRECHDIEASAASASVTQVLERTRLRRQWERDVGTELARVIDSILPTDFPMRLVFLDKSGSMHQSPETLSALALGYYNAATPASGSTLTILLAAPGETQIKFARAAAPPPASTRIPLGSATWFNEPIVRVLTALAPQVERLSTTVETLGWRPPAEEPPLSVFCLTDGMDNQSPSVLGDLHSLVRAISGLTTRVASHAAVCLGGDFNPDPTITQKGVGNNSGAAFKAKASSAPSHTYRDTAVARSSYSSCTFFIPSEHGGVETQRTDARVAAFPLLDTSFKSKSAHSQV